MIYSIALLQVMNAVVSQFARHVRTAVILGVVWSIVALAFAAQGHVVAIYKGGGQAWWPSLGYALAIFSIWALLTPVMDAGARRLARLPPVRRLLALTLGLPAAAAAHVGLFALIYWPLYNDGGRLPTRWAMAERMALPNLYTNALLYVLIISGALWRDSRHLRTPAPSTPMPLAPEISPLRSRGRNGWRFIAPTDIEWAVAAGDYVEVHRSGEAHLVEMSLTSLERLLPTGRFARIHRATLVRTDLIVGIESLGRGDALVRLAGGAEFRMSRRYRANLASLLQPGKRRDPSYPADRSRSPTGAGTVG